MMSTTTTTLPTMMMNTSTTTIPTSPAVVVKKASSANSNKPKRPLSAYNLFYRYKRAKVLEAHKLGNDTNKDATIRLVTCTPGLEDYTSETLLTSNMTQSQINELSRTEIRSALLNNLSPNDTRKRVHRKSHGAMSFLEMNKIMVSSWKNIDDTTRSVFEELAEIGRRMYHKRVAEYEDAESSSSQALSSSSSSSSSFMTSTSSFSMNESPKKKMKIMNSNNNDMNISSPPVSPQPTMWNSVVVDEVDMSKNNTFVVPTSSTGNIMSSSYTSRRVSIESTCDGSHFDGFNNTNNNVYNTDVLTCVTTPMRFPEMQVKNKQGGGLIVDFPPSMIESSSRSSSTMMMLQQQQQQHQQQQRVDSLVVDFPSSSPKSTNMDFDTLDLESPLPSYFDKMFDVEESQDNGTDTSSLGMDDISMSLSDSCENDFNVPSFEPVSMMNTKHHPANNNMEPTVDDFLKLIAELDETLPISSRAMAA